VERWIWPLRDSKKRGAELLGSPFEGTMVRS
jgi:hypothetical protein